MRKWKSLSRRGLSLLVALTMCAGLLQLPAFASGNCPCGQPECVCEGEDCACQEGCLCPLCVRTDEETEEPSEEAQEGVSQEEDQADVQEDVREDPSEDVEEDPQEDSPEQTAEPAPETAEDGNDEVALLADGEVCDGGEGCTHVAAIGDAHYSTLQDAFNAGGNVKLLNDVTLSAGATIAKDVSLDLNGHAIRRDTEKNFANLLTLTNGTLTIQDTTGSGVIETNPYRNSKGKDTGAALYAKNGSLAVISGTISGAVGIKAGAKDGAVDVEVSGTAVVAAHTKSATPDDSTINANAITVQYGAKLTVKDDAQIVGGVAAGVVMWDDNTTVDIQGGTITSEGTFAVSGNGSLDADGSLHENTLKVSGGTITSTFSTGCAIYHPQGGTAEITGGTISGPSGIEMRAGLLMVSGNPTITATEKVFACIPHKGGTTTTGAAIAIAQHTTKKDISVTINGGTLSGVKALNESNPQENDPAPQVSLSVTGGNFQGEVTVADTAEFISGGTFSSDVTSYLAPTAVQKDGKVVARTETDADAVAKIDNDVYASIQDAINAAESGETVTLLKKTADWNLPDTVMVIDKNVTLDLNQNTMNIVGVAGTKINQRTAGISVDTDASLTIRNGFVNCTGTPTTRWKEYDYNVLAAITVKAGGSAILDKVTFTTNGVALFPQGNAAKVVVKDSTIDAMGYAIGTNASNGGELGGVVIETTDSTLVSHTAAAILVNVPSAVTVDTCKVTGASHGLIVRGGTAVVKNSTITRNCPVYSEDESRNMAVALRGEKNDWGEGNYIPFAAITLGNKGTSAYQYPTKLTLIDTQVTSEDPNKVKFPAIYIYDDGKTENRVTLIVDQKSVIDESTSEGTVKAPEDSHVDIKNPVAQIKETGECYLTVQEAIAAAEAGETVVLLKDHAESVTVEKEQNIVLDLNGMTLTGAKNGKDEMSNVVTNKGTLTVKDSKWTSVEEAQKKDYTGGTILGGTDTGNGTAGRKGIAVVNEADATCTIESGVIKRGDNDTFGNYTVQNMGRMFIKGGLITNNSKTSNLVVNYNRDPKNSNTLGALKNVYMEISGGTVSQASMSAIKNEPGCELHITGTASVIERQGASNGYATNFYGKVIIDGGTITTNGLLGFFSHINAEPDRTEFPGEFSICGDAKIICNEIRVVNNISGGTTKEPPTLTISGNADVTANKLYQLQVNGNKLNVVDSTISNIDISGGTFSNAVLPKHCADGYFPVAKDGNTHGVANALTMQGPTTVVKGETISLSTNPAVEGTLTWTSSDESIATVNKDGVVTGVSDGAATITASINGVTASCEVTVTVPVTGVTLNKTELTLTEGGTDTLTATVAPENTTEDTTVTWTSSDTSVATVNEDGVVTGVSNGTATITATVNGHTATCEVTVHAHSWTWTFDGEKHWQTCSCGETQNRADHTWNEGEITTQPTETEKGVRTFTCTVCQATKTEEIPALGHTHAFSTDWSSNATNHWHECSCGEKTDSAEHTWNEGKITTQPTETEKGVRTFTCTVCQATKTEEVPALGHTHAFSTDWSSDATNHWHECSCGEKTDSAEHTWNEGVITTQPTEETEGVRTYTCTVCEATRTETIAKLEHVHNPSDAWEHDATGHWHACSCGEKVGFENHTWNNGVITTQPTEAERGVRTFTCTVCQATRTEEIPALGYTYTVTFVARGQTLATGAYAEGTPVTGITIPTVSGYTSGNYRYTFSRWNPAITAVTSDATYTAVYTSTYIGGGSGSGGTTGGSTRPSGGSSGGSGRPATSSVRPGGTTIGENRTPLAETPRLFTDVAEGSFCYDAVYWAVEQKITNGVTETTFVPNNACTRAQIVTFLWRAAGSPAAEGENPFTDVSADAYYYTAVLWAVANGITGGITPDTFAPDRTCTRGQAVTFLYRAAGSPEVSGTMPFSDVAADSYCANAVLWAVEKNVTSGTTATTFAPDNSCSRGQIVTFLYRDRA